MVEVWWLFARTGVVRCTRGGVSVVVRGTVGLLEGSFHSILSRLLTTAIPCRSEFNYFRLPPALPIWEAHFLCRGIFVR